MHKNSQVKNITCYITPHFEIKLQSLAWLPESHRDMYQNCFVRFCFLFFQLSLMSMFSYHETDFAIYKMKTFASHISVAMCCVGHFTIPHLSQSVDTPFTGRSQVITEFIGGKLSFLKIIRKRISLVYHKHKNREQLFLKYFAWKKYLRQIFVQ